MNEILLGWTWKKQKGSWIIGQVTGKSSSRHLTDYITLVLDKAPSLLLLCASFSSPIKQRVGWSKWSPRSLSAQILVWNKIEKKMYFSLK
jgi:hypothetical protein